MRRHCWRCRSARAILPRRVENIDLSRAHPPQSGCNRNIALSARFEATRTSILLTLGTKGEAGEWNEAAGSRKLNQPTDIAIAANGDVFVSQGHTPGPNGDARVLKFDKDGKFLAQWGGKGNEPGKFQVAHGLAIDPQGNLWVADRENQRIQVFTPTGAFVREMKFNGVPCSIAIGPQGAFMVNGYAAQIVQMDLSGKVLAVLGKPGKGPGAPRPARPTPGAREG